MGERLAIRRTFMGGVSDFKLTKVARLFYVAPAFFLTAIAFPLHVFVPRLYTDHVGIDADTVGAVLIATALFDAVSDPLMGALSDRTKQSARFGRRRIYIAIGGVILAGGFFLLMRPSSSSVWLMTLAFFIVYIGWTVAVIPYEALAIDVTSGYDERTRLMGIRETVAVVGLAFAIVTPVGLVEAGVVPDERASLALFALIFSPLLLISCAACGHFVKEPTVKARKKGVRARVVLHALAQNRPYLVLLLAFTLTTVAGSLPAALMLYFAEHVLGAETPGLFLLLWVGAAIVFAPLWVWLSERTEKRTAFVASIVLIGVAHGLMFFLQPGQFVIYGVLAVIAGVPFTGLLILPAAMQADAVDLGIQLSGDRDEGFYVGAWNLMRKVPAALASGAALAVLGWAGYQAGEVQSAQVKLTLRVMYALVPALIFSAGLIVALWYPIDRARHAEIRDGLVNDQ